MADIFISYKREDREWAEALSKALEAQGWSTWWDTRLQAGERFNAKIEEELDAAKCVIVLWSKLSVQSHWVIDEANEGLERDILLPLLLDAPKPPLGFRSIHATGILGWDKISNTGPFERVVNDVSRILGSAPEAPRNEAKPGSTTQKPVVSIAESLGMKFVRIEAGSFMMGSENGKEDERPVHRVDITNPFYLSETPVTQGQWEQVMGDTIQAISRKALIILSKTSGGIGYKHLFKS